MSLSDITTHSGVSVTCQNSLHCTVIIVRTPVSIRVRKSSFVCLHEARCLPNDITSINLRFLTLLPPLVPGRFDTRK